MALVIGKCRRCESSNVVCLQQFHYETEKIHDAHGLICLVCADDAQNKFGTVYGSAYVAEATRLLTPRRSVS